MANGGNVSLAGLEFEITTQADDALQHLESLASAFTKLVEPLAECAKSASGLATGLKTMNAALGKLDMSKIQEQASGAAKGIRELSEATQGRSDSAAIADIANQLKEMRSESTATAKAISDIARGFSDTGNSASRAAGEAERISKSAKEATRSWTEGKDVESLLGLSEADVKLEKFNRQINETKSALGKGVNADWGDEQIEKALLNLAKFRAERAKLDSAGKPSQGWTEGIDADYLMSMDEAQVKTASLIRQIEELQDRLRSPTRADLGEADIEKTLLQLIKLQKQLDKVQQSTGAIGGKDFSKLLGLNDAQIRIQSLKRQIDELKDKLENNVDPNFGSKEAEAAVLRIRELQRELNGLQGGLGQFVPQNFADIAHEIAAVASTVQKVWGVISGFYNFIDARSRDLQNVIRTAFRIGAAAIDKAAGALQRFLSIVTAIAKAIRPNLGIVTAQFTMFKSAVGGVLGGIVAIGKAIGRVLRYRIIRTIISGITSAMAGGLKNLYIWASLVGNRFEKTMDIIATSALYAKNSFAAMASPLLNEFAPIFDAFVDKVVEAMNILNQFFAMMTGASTYTRAIKVAQTYAEANGDVAKSLKNANDEMKKFLLGIDELNIFDPGKDSDKNGAGSDGLDYSGMFEEVPIDNNFLEAIERIKEALSGIPERFRIAWEMTGIEAVEKWKKLFKDVFELAKAIGKSIVNIFNLRGVEYLISLYGMTGSIGEAIDAIVESIKEAWEENRRGEKMLDAFITMLTIINNTIKSIIDAFAAAWRENKLGVAIMANVLEIVTNLFNAVGNLTNAFRNAWIVWGKSIWQAILTTINDVLTAVNRITRATSDWAANVDFKPFLQSLNNLLWAFERLTSVIVDAFAWAWENVLLPFGKWAIQSGLPAAINAIADAIGNLTYLFSGLSLQMRGLGDLIEFNFFQELADDIDAIDFAALGTRLGEVLNNVFQSVPWEDVGNLLGALFNGVLDFIHGAVTTFNWEKNINALFEGIRAFIERVDWGKVDETLHTLLTAALYFLQKAVEEFDWNGLGHQIVQAFEDFVVPIVTLKVKAFFETVGGIIQEGPAIILAAIGLFFASVSARMLGLPAVAAFGKTALGLVYIGITNVAGAITGGIPTVTGAIGTVASQAGAALAAAAPVIAGGAAVIGGTLLAEYAIFDKKFKEANDDHYAATENYCNALAYAYEKGGQEALNAVTGSNISLEQAQAEARRKYEEMPHDMWSGFAAGWNTYFGKDGAGLGAYAKDAFTGMLNAVKNLLGIHSPSTEFAEIGGNTALGFAEGFEDKWSTIPSTMTALFGTLKSTVGGLMSSIGTNISSTWSGIRQSVETAATGIQTKVSTAFNNLKSTTSSIFSSLRSTAQSTMSAISSSVASMASSVGSRIASIKSSLSGVASTVSSSLSSVQSSISKVASDAAKAVEDARKKLSDSKTTISVGGKFASGGFPDEGQLFVARERGPEFVGNMGNRTTVANNDQIVDGVASGVAQANVDLIQVIATVGSQLINAIHETAESGGQPVSEAQLVRLLMRSQNRMNRATGYA